MHWLEDALLKRGLVTAAQLDAIARWPRFADMGFVERFLRSGLAPLVAEGKLSSDPGTALMDPLVLTCSDTGNV